MTVYLLAHGSVDPRHAEDVAAIAERLGARLDVEVRPAYLDHCGPSLAQAADRPGVVVPLLFSPGYHVKVDVGLAVAEARVRLRLADPPLLTSGAAWGAALLDEVRRAWAGRKPVLVTAGTRDAEVLRMWDETAAALGVPVVHASGPGRRLSPDRQPAVAVPLLVARGFFADQIAAQAAAAGLPVTDPAGSSASLIAELTRVARRAWHEQP